MPPTWFNVFGPGLRINDKRVIPDLFSDAFSGEAITLLSDGKATRSFCYVSDAIDGFLKVMLAGRPGEAYNVGNDSEEVAMLELARRISSLFGGLDVSFQSSKDKDYLTDNPQRRFPDLTKIRSELGYQPKVSMDEGLRRMKDWYSRNR